jgi:hypothetical protein
VNECFLEGFLDNVFCVLSAACVAKRKRENASLVALKQTFKSQFISILCGGDDESFVRSGITGRSNGHDWFANVVQDLTLHGALPFEWARVIQHCLLPTPGQWARSEPNLWSCKSLIFRAEYWFGNVKS